MFGKMVFVVKVNAALAKIGLDPTSVPPAVRQSVQALGTQCNLTAQETAVLLAEMIPDDELGLPVAMTKNLLKNEWERDGKFRPDVVEKVRVAIEKAGLEYDAARGSR